MSTNILKEGMQKFQNIVERKLCSCFGQLLHMLFEDKHDANSGYGACIYLAFLDFTTVSMNIL